MKKCKKIYEMLIILFIIIMCYPLLFLIVGSFMGEAELTQNLGMIYSELWQQYASWSLLPKEPNIWMYIKVLLDSPEFLTAFWNTLKVTVITAILQCIVNVPAAWGISRYKFYGKKIIFWLYLLLAILPFQVLMLPQYLVLDKLSLLNTIWAIILPVVFSPQFVLILYYFFVKISNSVIENAKLEGASEWEIFAYIGVPMVKKGVFVAVILSIIECFNIVEQPLLFLESKELWTLSMYLPNVKVEGIGENFVMAIMTIMPVMLIFFRGQAFLEEEQGLK